MDVVGACGRTSPMPGKQEGCDRRGSATSSAAGTLHGRPWSLWLRDACLQPSYAQASGQRGGRGIWSGWHKPLEGMTLQHRPGPPHTMPSGSCGLGRRLPPRTCLPSRRPRSSPPRRRHHHVPYSTWRDLYSLGEVTLSCMPRSFAPVLPDGQPPNAPCVHCLFRFVKSTVEVHFAPIFAIARDKGAIPRRFESIRLAVDGGRPAAHSPEGVDRDAGPASATS